LEEKTYYYCVGTIGEIGDATAQVEEVDVNSEMIELAWKAKLK